MSLLPAFWTKRPEPPLRSQDPEALGDAVKALVAAQMGVLRAAIIARAAFLRAQAAATDSNEDKKFLQARVGELEFVLGQTGEEG